MARDNYDKFSAEIKDNMKKGNRSPVSKSQERQGSGKGDMPRKTNKTQYDKNFDQINWKSKKKGRKKSR